MTPEQRSFVECVREHNEHAINSYSGSEFGPDDHEIEIRDLLSIIDSLQSSKLTKQEHITAFDNVFGQQNGFTEAWAGWYECAKFLDAVDEDKQ